MDVQSIYNLMLALLSVGLLVSSLEYAVKANVFATDGLLAWNTMQLRWSHRLRHGPLGLVLGRLFTKEGLTFLFIMRILLVGLALVAPAGSLERWLSILLLTADLLLTSVITFYGSDGSDQMTIILLVTFFLCCPPFATQTLLLSGLWFIAIQACLSYSIAGIAKLVSTEWRGGTAVYDIFCTKTYGSRWAAELLKDRRWLKLFLCWGVIIAETLFPLCLFLPWPFALIFLGWGLLFHLLNAIIMGLNSFLWAFLATYPAILFVNHVITTYFQM